MWCLNTATYQLHYKQDHSSAVYAILSHVWTQGPGGEQSFQDVQSIHDAARRSLLDSTPDAVPDDDPRLLKLLRNQLSPKIRNCCDFTRLKGFEFVWIDSCCIDKAHSAELSEAIDSMFDWYSDATVCYVFLDDVPETEDPKAQKSCFRASRWFQRGWTLQELLAPRHNVFLSKNWRVIGTKTSLATVIETVTGIDADILLRRRPLRSASVARRMSWAAHRETTYVEDEAYCLMGIFGVRIPVIYGEGLHAFVRLHEEIMKRIPDQTLFAWGYMCPLNPLAAERVSSHLEEVPPDHHRASKAAYLCASRAIDFRFSSGFTPLSHDTLTSTLGTPIPEPPTYTVSSYGICALFPTFTLHLPTTNTPRPKLQLAILSCQDSQGRIPALIISEQDGQLLGALKPTSPRATFTRDGILKLPRVAPKPSTRRARASGARVARAPASLDIRFSRSYIRLCLLPPEELALAIARDPNVYSMRNLCIQAQRLEAHSQLFTLADCAKTPGHVPIGYKIVLAPWCLAHLRDLGYTISVDTALATEELVLVIMPPRVGTHRLESSFLLHHHDGSSVTISIAPCPQVASRAKSSPGSLHVTVSWGKAEPASESLFR
ncbi:heterokaryon incompatibility protein-domain-containing protein [Cubamyces lactineus]|nr:heterokaryon incompatibility protein-domain-containing protein [Cubamyces lactineus]